MKRAFVVLLALAALAAPAAAVDTAGSATPPFTVIFAAGAGWDGLFDDAFAAFMAGHGMAALDPLRLWRTGWRIGYEVSRFTVVVSSTRLNNYLFGAYGASPRAHYAWDSVDLLAGYDIVSADTVTWNLAAGASLGKVLLQAYDSAGGSYDAVAGTGGMVDLVTDGFWAPEIETSIGIRLFRDTESKLSGWLTVGVSAGWLPYDATWRLFGDPVVTGVPRPAEFYVRPGLWLGFRGQ
jgi:hypothetical protein